MSPIVIIGSGLAAYTTARELRKLDKEAPLAVITRDHGEFYSKPMLSNGFAANKTADQLAMKTAEQMAAELGAQVLTRVEVEAIDSECREVRWAGHHLAYSKLVLALGADQTDPGLDGDGAAEVLTVNDLASYRHCRALLADRRKVVILGAGLIGCEFANDWLSAGIDVTLVDPAGWPLSRLLPEATGHYLAGRLSDAGIRFHLGAAARSVSKHGQSYSVQLDNGELLEADLVLSAIGLRPRTGLAQAAGLHTGRGIIVDRTLRTSADGIYALGDCAQVDGLTLPFVMPLMQAARALAQTLAGTPTEVRYPAMPVVVKTPACPTTVCPPPAGARGEWHETAIDGSMRALFVDEGDAPLGYALLGAANGEKQALTAQMPSWL